MTADESWIPFSGLVATTHRIDAYDGVRLSPDALLQLVSQMNSGNVPMIGHHDQTRPLRTRNVHATVITLDDGELAATVDGEIIEDDWGALGDVGGFSFATSYPLDPAVWTNPPNPQVRLAADAAWFDAQDIAVACGTIATSVPTRGDEYLQFSAIPLAKIIIEVGAALTIGLAGNEISRGIHYLIGRRKTPTGADPATPTIVELHVGDGPPRSKFVVTTSDPEVATAAIRAIPDTLAALSNHVPAPVIAWWDASGEGQWEVPK